MIYESTLRRISVFPKKLKRGLKALTKRLALPVLLIGIATVFTMAVNYDETRPWITAGGLSLYGLGITLTIWHRNLSKAQLKKLDQIGATMTLASIPVLLIIASLMFWPEHKFWCFAGIATTIIGTYWAIISLLNMK